MSIQIVKTIREMQDIAERFRCGGKIVSVVPTMGYLHRGHARLIEIARSRADVVITTIFVNPTQFAPNEDFNRYPRDLEHDKIIAQDAGSDFIFFPEVAEMYPEDFNSTVEVERASKILEGAFRPVHFRGVTTVVAKLFHITKPHIAVFGQKDAQQAFIVQKMAKDLNFDIDIIIAPIVREEDGLALSSRNVYLNETERKNALVLYRSLQHAAQRIRDGAKKAADIRVEIEKIIKSGNPSQIDYIAIVNPEIFKEVEIIESPEVLVAIAVRFGSTRLIDNICIQLQ
ncbi:MAG: pantoate--beta-alanine ligase [Ignavibacteriales bacterium]|nr:pantoate--beta-alanine ligase [Ignavibacteriales bacterium]